ncbi:MAG: hypothetical protein A2W80_05275 [Candidatus Riflebacteria bacterium GWC2_50_8]|nr:MAG: hypothetical protein A2W80_05275 [Candidatus Riflebacteria bacterium GWC2_50_8]
MTNDQNDENSDVTPELVQKLQDVKDRCMPAPGISYRAFYLFLLFCSLIQYLSHQMVVDFIDWDSLRYAHGLLPLNVLMMRNAIVPGLLPAAILSFFLLSFKFKSLRSPVFLAWFALIMFGLTACHSWTSAIFSFHLVPRISP